jgi:DNA-binding response OmpR family regulator
MNSRESFSDEPVTAGSRPRVVVVNEDDVKRRMVANALRKDGYEVVEKRFVPEVLELFGEKVRAPDAVIGGGLAVLVGLRERGWRTPVVLTEKTRALAMRYTPDAILTEPLDVDALRKAMLSLLWPKTTLPAID